MLGFCLTLGTTDGWAWFSQVATARMTAKERASLAFTTLKSLTRDEAELVASSALGTAGYPLPPFLDSMADARYWASLATKAELKSYALAAYEALPIKEQNAFFQHIREVEV
jgi:hypothetical protein